MSAGPLKDWLRLSRLPFHSVGILPFILGSLLARHSAGVFDMQVFFLGLLAVVLIMLATYLNGEVHDIREDALGRTSRNAFSGGSQVLVEQRVEPAVVKTISYLAIILAMGIGLILQFSYRRGIWTIPLGITGIAAGFFYSKPPLRWVERGIGELLIAYAYGWLPVAVGFYLQTAVLPPVVHLVSLPIAGTVFCVILINEFPDQPADTLAGKRNLLVRLGKPTAARLYAAVSILSGVFFWVCLARGFAQDLAGSMGEAAFWVHLPFFFVSLALSFSMLRAAYISGQALERMCGLTILVNIGTTAACIAGILQTS